MFTHFRPCSFLHIILYYCSILLTLDQISLFDLMLLFLTLVRGSPISRCSVRFKMPSSSSLLLFLPRSDDLTWVLIAMVICGSIGYSIGSDPRVTEAALSCGRTKSPTGIKFVSTFVHEMEQLSQAVTSQNFGTHFSNSTPPIYGLLQCHGDLSHTDCLLCYAATRNKVPRCLPSMSARIYLDGCFLRYDNYSFYHESTDPFRDLVNCTSNLGAVLDEAVKPEFDVVVDHVIRNLTEKAVLNGGFSVIEVKGRDVSGYGLAQCWKTLSSNECNECLEKAGAGLRKCAPSREGRGLNAGCYMRYSTYKFYNDDRDQNSSTGLSKTGLAVTIALCVAAFLLLSLVAGYVSYARLGKTRKGHDDLRIVSISIKKSDLSFKYETLENATNYFNASKKLGQGGSGSVYEGTLPDGRVVAVKRLIFNTRQWVDDFFNEVNLISNIEHKNLVKLLGCSIEGPESLLVYEYVTNRSLDRFIFDKSHVLNWKQRLHIIVGTAEGLAYLHGGSETRIIHRDIKSSNVLLDEHLNPKIADFGLVRCFGPDQTHITTGIAGTLGYMAPEYLVRGQLTDKSDVYSFGVLVLEIVCGRRSNVFTENSGSLLQMVWRHLKLNRLSEAVDPSLRDKFPPQEASNVLQIGLLCTQASVPLRPSMREVIFMLNHVEHEIPTPSQPPFMNSSVIDPARLSECYSVNSSASNPTTTRIEVSTSSESSVRSARPSDIK